MALDRKPRRIQRLGASTKWGRVTAILCLRGERYYLLVRGKDVALMPGIAIEEPSNGR